MRLKVPTVLQSRTTKAITGYPTDCRALARAKPTRPIPIMETVGFRLLVFVLGTGNKSLRLNLHAFVAPSGLRSFSGLLTRGWRYDHPAGLPRGGPPFAYLGLRLANAFGVDPPNPGILRLFRRRCIIMAVIPQSPKGQDFLPNASRQVCL